MTLDLPNTPSPDDLWEMDRAHSLHPWTNFGSFEKEGSLVIARGEGCYLWDAEGRRYFDAIGGMWCTNVGLGRKDMARAIADQLETGGVFVNAFSVSDPRVAFGGVKKSGFGRELSHFGVREFCNAQTVWLDRK